MKNLQKWDREPSPVLNRGSITLEAAIALPIYMFAIVAIMSIMQMINAYMMIQASVYKTGKEVALYMPAKEEIDKVTVPGLSELITAAASDGYAKRELEKSLDNNSHLKRYVGRDISFVNSKYVAKGSSADVIDVIATYSLRPAANFFGISNFYMVSRARLHPWTGFDISNTSDDEHEERIVYITETGTVYHLTRSCTYLDLSIVNVSSEEVPGLRNANGGKYYPCEMCGGGSGSVYITGQGDRYHSLVSCSGLKRTIFEVPISEVKDKRACSRCGG